MKIAVVGAGISGLSSAVFLRQQYEVHLFEADTRLGGHAHTVTVHEAHQDVPVDTGFLVYNTLTYPLFTRWLDYLQVSSTDSDMSLSIQNPSGLEWAGTDWGSIFAQKRNAFNPKFLGMLGEIHRFHRQAQENLALSKRYNWTLSDLVQSRRMSSTFLQLYLLPMTGAIWSISYARALQFPAATFLTFCLNHHLLQINGRPVWKTIRGGSIEYVRRAALKIPHIHLRSRVEALRPDRDGLILRIGGEEQKFDKVVLATHAPISTKILAPHFPQLADLLSPLKVSGNVAHLHRDSRVMPQRKKCWSSWNVKARPQVEDERPISLSYYLNKLQPLPTRTDYFVTLNADQEPDLQERSFRYDHPQFDAPAIEVQKRLPSIQGKDGIFFAGAWTRYGFHEDGILSAANLARQLDCRLPWE